MRSVSLNSLLVLALISASHAGEAPNKGGEKGKAKAKAPPPPPKPVAPIEETVAVGKGGYLVQAKDKLPLQPFITENIHGPLPTNDWCSSVLWEPFSSNHFAHPLAMKCDKTGLRLAYPDLRADAKRFATEFTQSDLTIGHSAEANFPDARLDAYSDWFLRVQFKNADHVLQTTYGHGAPFVFVRAQGGNVSIKFAAAPEIWFGKAGDAVVGISVRNKHYALFGLPASRWKQIDTALENEGAPENFCSVALLPEKDAKLLELFRAYAYNEVIDTKVAWIYNEAQATVETTFTYTTKSVAPGGKAGTLFALYPHHWRNSDTPTLEYGYDTVRGRMKLAAGENFKTRMRFNGALPVVPSPQRSSDVTQHLSALLKDAMAQKLDDPGDSYWGGKPLDQMSLLLPIAEQLGDKASADTLLQNLKARLENWLTSPATPPNKKERYFCYNKRWGALTGQNPSYGSDELNDHHFHYGYFIRAAAEVARHDPAWARPENFGGMIELLIRDIAAPDRKDALFPFLRTFDIYAGHAWAGGSAINSSGNNQESISEAINAWTGIYLWGLATNNKELRDLGIFLYTQEVAACENYWHDVYKQFPKEYQRTSAVLVFNGSSAYATWFSGKPEHCHGILLLPIQPGSFYLGRHPEFVRRNIDNVVALANNKPLEWMEFFAPYLALIDPDTALQWYDTQASKLSPRARPIAYHWITALQALGKLDTEVFADHPSALVFNKNGKRTYAVYNPGEAPLKVQFSNGPSVQASKGLSLKE